MALVMTAEKFQRCKPGTVFAYGQRWAFSSLLILDEIIMGNGYWGFWAIDPMWVESDESHEDSVFLDDMLSNGTSRPSNDSSTKYMAYDGDDFSTFFVLERADLDRIWALVASIPPAPRDALTELARLGQEYDAAPPAAGLICPHPLNVTGTPFGDETHATVTGSNGRRGERQRPSESGAG